MASHHTGEQTHERSVQFLDWPYHLPILCPSDEWIEAENKLLQKYTPTTFLKKYGISLETYQSISKDLKERKTRAMARAIYNGERVVAAYKVIMQINRMTFDPSVRMSARWLAYACEETANMNDDAFEVWARREGTKENFKNVANELRKERRACPSVLHHREQSNEMLNEEEGLAEHPTKHCNNEEHAISDDRARASSPSPSETGSAGSWTVLREDESHSEDELSISEADLPNDAPADSHQELEQLASSNETYTSQTWSPKESHNTTTSSADVNNLSDEVDPEWSLDAEQETEVGAEVHVDGLQTERELLQMQLNALERTKSDLECSKEQLQELNAEKETQLDSCHAEIQVLRNCMECLETEVDQLNKDLTSSRKQGVIWQQRHTLMTKHLFEADAFNAESTAKYDHLKFCNKEIKKDYALLREGMEHMWQDYLTIKGDLSNEQLELHKTTDCLLKENEMLHLRCQTFEDAFDHAVVQKSKEDIEFLKKAMNRQHEGLRTHLAESESRCTQFGNMYERANDDVKSLLSKNKLLSEELAATQAEYVEAQLQLDSENPGSQADVVATAGEYAELEEEKTKLREEVQRLEKELMEAERLEAQNATLIAEKEELKIEKMNLEAELTSVQEQDEELGVEYENLYEDHDKLNTVAEGLKNKNIGLRLEAGMLMSEIKALRSANASLTRERGVAGLGWKLQADY